MNFLKRLSAALTARILRLKSKPELGKLQEFSIYLTRDGCIELRTPNDKPIRFDPQGGTGLASRNIDCLHNESLSPFFKRNPLGGFDYIGKICGKCGVIIIPKPFAAAGYYEIYEVKNLKNNGSIQYDDPYQTP